MKINTLIKLFAGITVVLSLLVAGITFAIVNKHYKLKYRSDEALRKEFDSLMIVVAIRSNEVKQIRLAFDSVSAVSANQGKEIDSLIKNKELQKAENEKKYHSIGSIPDDKLNRILSGKLK